MTALRRGTATILLISALAVSAAAQAPVRMTGYFISQWNSDIAPGLTRGMVSPVLFSSVVDGVEEPRPVGIGGEGGALHVARLDGGTSSGRVSTQVLAIDAAAYPNAFVHDAGRIRESSSRIDHPALNGNPHAVLIVTPIAGSGFPTPVGVSFSAFNGHWSIENQDRRPIGERRFYVLAVDLRTGPGIDELIYADIVEVRPGRGGYLPHEAPLPFLDPDLAVFVTPEVTRDPYTAEPIHVYHNGARWVAVNAQLQPLPDTIRLHVVAFSALEEDRGLGVSVAEAREPEPPQRRAYRTWVEGDLEGIRSGYGEFVARVTFRNGTREPVDVYRIDRAGERIFVTQIEARSDDRVPSFVARGRTTEYWLLDGVVQMLYLVGGEPEQGMLFGTPR